LDRIEASTREGDQIPHSVPAAEPAAARWIVGGIFFVIAAWLIAAVCTLQIEYYDGLSAITNARYFLGITDRYVADRAPMMALLLVPAELVRTTLGLHPLDVRPYHVWLALFHGAYLVLTYRLLTRAFGSSWPVFLAWGAAIPNFMFFSYGPFLSHDIIPGVLLLAMLIGCDRYFGERSISVWMGLVALGAIAALVKQTFGVFWILLVLTSFFRCTTSAGTEARTTLLRLACGALASGAVTWIVMGCLLGDADPQAPLLIRPLRNLQYLSGVYEGRNVVFPLWIYLRNSPAYGWLAMLLLIPGWILSIRGTRLQQSIAIAWLGGVVFMHLLPLREVRYVAFLAPLTAALLVPPLQFIAKRKSALVAAFLVLALDVGNCTLEAARIFHPFYTSGVERRFFDLLDDPANRRNPILVNTPMMSFVAPIPSPLAADRYHRIFHFGLVHLRSLYDCRDLRVIADERSALRSAAASPDGSLLLHSTQILARGPSWRSGTPVADADFMQCAALCRSRIVRLRERSEDGPGDSETVMIRPADDDDGTPSIQGEPCAEPSLGELLPLLRLESTGRSYWLRRTGPDSYAISGLSSLDSIAGSRATIRRFEIDRQMRISPAQ
jgi:hypothetical protein